MPAQCSGSTRFEKLLQEVSGFLHLARPESCHGLQLKQGGILARPWKDCDHIPRFPVSLLAVEQPGITDSSFGVGLPRFHQTAVSRFGPSLVTGLLLGPRQILAGVPIGLPRDDVDFVPVEVRRETFANRPAASLRFRYAGEEYLLVVSARDRLLGTPPDAAFPEGSFVSGERDGRSFVLWEREGASCIVVSEVDVTQAFDLVRRLFT